MSRAGTLITVAVPFVRLGMVLAISFLEAPLKFWAPGLTLPLRLGIGRLVFRALNLAEMALVALLAVAGVAVGMPGAGWGLLAVLAAVLVVQVLLLRPRWDRRAGQIVAGQAPPPARLHLAYIALEGARCSPGRPSGWPSPARCCRDGVDERPVAPRPVAGPGRPR